jgi:Bacterial SH3 domain
MKVYKKLMIAAIALVAAMGIAHADACVVNDPTGTPLNVRKNPGQNAPIIGALNNGITVVVRDRRGEWVNVVPHEAPGKSGWVWRKYLDCSESATEDPSGRYARVYDASHLARHPDQLVKEVNLSIKRASSKGYSHDFTLSIRLRGRNDVLKTEGPCHGEGSGLSCLVECDGGGIRVEPRGNYVMMYLDRIRVAACGESVIDGGEEISGGKDDKVFRLNRVPDRAGS